MELLNETVPLIDRVAKENGYKLCDIRTRSGYRIYVSDTNGAGVYPEDVDLIIRGKGEAEAERWLLKEKFK